MQPVVWLSNWDMNWMAGKLFPSSFNSDIKHAYFPCLTMCTDHLTERTGLGMPSLVYFFQ